MNTILIANPKGGSGKTTLSTNLAGYFASRGKHVVLSDMDRQKSATAWLERRNQSLPLIHNLAGRKESDIRKNTDWLIIDAPAGMHGDKFKTAVKHADWVVVPIQPSAFDIGAADDFLAILREEKAIRKERTFVTVVGMRIDARTKSTIELMSFLDRTGLPAITNLRNAQIYTQAAAQGLSLFDMRPSTVKQDMQQWAPLLHWLVNG